MLIRQLQKPGDYARGVLIQDENLRLAIANDQNIAAARQNLKDGIVPEPTLLQKQSRAEQQTQSSDAKQTAYGHLASLLPSFDTVELNTKVNKFLSTLTTDNDIEFFNFYWNDIKRELQTKDLSRMSVAIFKKILQKVMRENTAQAGLSTQTSLSAESPSLNEVSELMKVLPNRQTIINIYQRLHDLNQPLANNYKLFIYMIPNKGLQDALNAASPAVRQEVIQTVMSEMRSVDPRNAVWEALLETKPDSLFISEAFDMLPQVNESKILNAYDKVSPNYFEKVLNASRKDIANEIREGKSTKVPNRPRQEEQNLSPEEQEYARLLAATQQLEARRRPPAPAPRSASAPRPVSRVRISTRPRGQPAEPRTPRRMRGDIYMPPGTNIDTGLTRESPVPQTEMDKLIANPKSSRFSLSFFKKGNKVKSGKGIAPQPRMFHDFGKYLIDGTELDKQILSVKYQSGAPIPNFGRKTAISDTFHELLKDLVETQKLNKSLMKELEPTERRALETLLIKSGVGVGLGIKEITPTNEDKEKMNRLQLLQGSFNAGNNSRELIHELRSLVIYFMNSGRIGKREALETLQTLV